MIVVINDLAVAQTEGNKENMKALIHLLNYAATHPNAKIRNYRSGMTLNAHSERSYLSLPKECSWAGGHYFLSDHSNNPAAAKPNGVILVLCNMLKIIMHSTSETEIASTFEN